MIDHDRSMWIVSYYHNDLGKQIWSSFWDDLLLTCRENDETHEPTFHKPLWSKNFMQKNHRELLVSRKPMIRKYRTMELVCYVWSLPPKKSSFWTAYSIHLDVFFWLKKVTWDISDIGNPFLAAFGVGVSYDIKWLNVQLLISIFAKATVVSILALQPAWVRYDPLHRREVCIDWCPTVLNLEFLIKDRVSPVSPNDGQGWKRWQKGVNMLSQIWSFQIDIK